ncbi:MAG: phosphatidylglycerophosphatase A [Phycisphaerales bacterium]|nr:phosphatidylglycerophosphatase A [Phycisphaerales bacterium]
MRLMLVTAFGLGLCKPGPGTWGSILPLVVAAVGGHWCPDVVTLVMGVLAVLASVLCVQLTPWAEARFGRHDASEIVIDEVAGMALALAIVFAVPAAMTHLTWAMAAAFVLFRVLDIAKPGPINALQRCAGGWGVLLDDLAAGLLAGAIVAGGLLLAG